MALNARHFRFLPSIGNNTALCEQEIGDGAACRPVRAVLFCIQESTGCYAYTVFSPQIPFSSMAHPLARQPICLQAYAQRLLHPHSAVALELEKLRVRDSSLQNAKIPLKIAFLLPSCYYTLNRKRCQWFVQYVNTPCGFLQIRRNLLRLPSLRAVSTLLYIENLLAVMPTQYPATEIPF